MECTTSRDTGDGAARRAVVEIEDDTLVNWASSAELLVVMVTVVRDDDCPRKEGYSLAMGNYVPLGGIRTRGTGEGLAATPNRRAECR